jgi:hypothetical protein
MYVKKGIIFSYLKNEIDGQEIQKKTRPEIP